MSKALLKAVTKIEDAQNLWRKLQEDVNKDTLDASKEEEENEDSQGGVFLRGGLLLMRISWRGRGWSWCWLLAIVEI